jgi:hypothetical protein
MHIAQTPATYSFGLVSLNVLDSEVIPNNSKRLLYFLKNRTATLLLENQALIGKHRFNDVSAILDCKDKKK